MKGTPVRQIVRQPEPEPGNELHKVQVETNEEAVRNKIAELVDEVRLILSSRSNLLACYWFVQAYFLLNLGFLSKAGLKFTADILGLC